MWHPWTAVLARLSSATARLAVRLPDLARLEAVHREEARRAGHGHWAAPSLFAGFFAFTLLGHAAWRRLGLLCLAERPFADPAHLVVVMAREGMSVRVGRRRARSLLGSGVLTIWSAITPEREEPIAMTRSVESVVARSRRTLSVRRLPVIGTTGLDGSNHSPWIALTASCGIPARCARLRRGGQWRKDE